MHFLSWIFDVATQCSLTERETLILVLRVIFLLFLFLFQLLQFLFEGKFLRWHHFLSTLPLVQFFVCVCSGVCCHFGNLFAWNLLLERRGLEVVCLIFRAWKDEVEDGNGSYRVSGCHRLDVNWWDIDTTYISQMCIGWMSLKLDHEESMCFL